MSILAPMNNIAQAVATISVLFMCTVYHYNTPQFQWPQPSVTIVMLVLFLATMAPFRAKGMAFLRTTGRNGWKGKNCDCTVTMTGEMTTRGLKSAERKRHSLGQADKPTACISHATSVGSSSSLPNATVDFLNPLGTPWCLAITTTHDD